MLIAEQLLLLALDPLSGDWLDRAAADPAVLTAALLLELATLGDLRLQAGQLQLQPGPPNYHLLIQDVRARLQQTTPATAAQLLANRHITPSGLAGQLLRGLAARDVLHRDGKRRYRWFGEQRYPIRSMQARQDALRRIERALASSDALDGIALLILLHAAALGTRLLTPDMATQLKQRLLGLDAEIKHGTLPPDRAQALRSMVAIGDALVSQRRQ